MFAARIDGAAELADRLERFPAALAQALAVKADALAAALVDKVVNQKLAGEALNAGSGKLAASIAAEIVPGPEGFEASVGSYGDVKYAAIQEYGGKTAPHEILPVKGQALAFLGAAGLAFARRVEHPGSLIPAHAYLGASLAEMADEIRDALAASVDESWTST